MARQPQRQSRRSLTSRKQKRIIRVLTEGEVTEQIYLRAFCGEHVNLEFGQTSGCVPLTLVQRARAELKANRRAHKDDRFDEIWCVFDRDDHPNLKQSIREARDAGVRIAFSNPCFELWLVWHLENCTAHVERNVVQRRSRDLGITEGKHITREAIPKLVKGFSAAKQRAQELDSRREQDGTEYGANPHSDVWRLVELLQQED